MLRRMAKREGQAPITAAVWGAFAKDACLWLIPALLVLPIYLVVLGVSAIVGDGSLLEASEGVRGRINTALGPLLVLCGAAAGVFTARLASDAEGYVTGAFFALITAGLGVVLSVRELRRAAERR